MFVRTRREEGFEMITVNRGPALAGVLLAIGAVSFALAAIDSFPAPGRIPSGMAYDGEHLLVANDSGFRRIFTLDPETGAELGSFLAPSRTGLDGRGSPNGLAYDGAGRLFVTDIDQIVFEIEADGSAIVNSIELPFRGGSVAFDGMNLYVNDFDSREFLVLDRSGNTVGGFTTELRAAGLTYDNLTGLLWGVSVFTDEIVQMTVTGDIVRRCEGPRDPDVPGAGAIVLGAGRMYVSQWTPSDAPPDEPGTIWVLDPRELDCEPPMGRTISIELRPGHSVAPINPYRRGTIRVAIFSAQDFSAESVVPESVRFGATGTEAAADRWRSKDVDHDGRDDLVLEFPMASTGIGCGDDAVRLTALARDGQQLTGTDMIHTVGCRD